MSLLQKSIYHPHTEHVFHAVKKHVLAMNEHKHSLNVKHLQRYIAQHFNRTSQEYKNNVAHNYVILFSLSDWKHCNYANAEIIHNDKLALGYKVDLSEYNTYEQILDSNMTERKHNKTGMKLGAYIESLEETYKEIIKKLDSKLDNYNSEFKSVSYPIKDVDTGYTLIKTTNVLVSRIKVGDEFKILLSGCGTFVGLQLQNISETFQTRM